MQYIIYLLCSNIITDFPFETIGYESLAISYLENGEYINSTKNNHWDKFFTYKEQLLLNELYKDYKRFNYNFINLSWKQKIQIFFLIFFPMSFEKLTFKSNNTNLKIRFSKITFPISKLSATCCF